MAAGSNFAAGKTNYKTTVMARILTILLMLVALGCGTSCASDEPVRMDGNTNTSAYFSGKKVLIAYFSWGGTTQRMAEQIQAVTGGDLFRIEPVNPYPTDYTACTQVAHQEKDDNARPAIRDKVPGWDDYDVVFIGCPVWWWTTPMIIHTFCESYDFTGKTVVPFCTYAATYRDETLAEIVSSTPAAVHLTGEGLTSGAITAARIQTWIDLINEEWNNAHPGSGTVMSGKVDLWQEGNIPTVTQNIHNSDGPDFMPNMEVFTVGEEVTPKGAMVICPGGAFAFRSMQNEGYDIADMFVSMGYQCFIVNYRIQPYTMRESATDLQCAIRYVKAHAADYRIVPGNVALVGFSAGGILNGEVLLNWRDLTNGTLLDANYRPDELDQVPVNACAVGMIYSFYGRLSVSMNDVATLRAANLPPAFYCWGTRDGFAGQFTQNSAAVEQAGCRVKRKILEGYPHGYGSGGSADVWGRDFDAFLTPIMAGVGGIKVDDIAPDHVYSLQGMPVDLDTAANGIYIVRQGGVTRKIVKHR